MKTQGLFGVLSLPSPLHTCSTALVGVALFCLATSARADLSNFQRLYSFGNAELSGSFPDRVIECSDGRLYGTAAHETSEFEGIIYRINKDGSGYAVLHRFKETAPTGDRPSDGLLEASDGSLYGTTTEGGANGKGTLFRIKKDGTGLSVVYAFRGPTNGDVQEANGRLIEGSDGALYGTSWQGGTPNVGAVFRVQKDGTQFQMLRQFGSTGDGAFPVAGLLEGGDGLLYGTTSSGVLGARGVIFRMRKNGADYQILRQLYLAAGDPAVPFAELIEDSEGVLYGTSREGGNANHGTVFKLQKDGTGFVVLRSFGAPGDPRFPRAAVTIGPDGALYGTSGSAGEFSSGTLFKLNRDGTGFRVIRQFPGTPTDGWNLAAPLCLGSDGLFYSSTASGGQYNQGSLFRFNPSNDAYTPIWQFSGAGGVPTTPQNLIEGPAGYLYGATVSGGIKRQGVLYRLRRDGTGFQVLRDIGLTTNEGFNVRGLMFASDGNLYGTASQGGAGGAGTLFRLTSEGSDFTILHTFGMPGDGIGPHSAVIEGSDGNLYGTTRQGGASSCGTVFRINKNSGIYQILRSFVEPGSDGCLLQESVIEAKDGILYGVTMLGGTTAAGTVFRINRDGTGYQQLRSFVRDSSDAQNPSGRLLEASDGFLYGVTVSGGLANAGTVFKISKDGNTYAVIKSFTNGLGQIGNSPSGPLWEASDGALYGSAQVGGNYDAGVLFKLNKDGTGFQVLHHFGPPTLSRAGHSGIIRGSDQAFYGVGGGGDLGLGILYRYGHAIGLTKNGESIQLSCTGIPGHLYHIQRSTDLQTWTLLIGRSITTSPVIQYTDPAPPPSCALYRIVPASSTQP